MWSLGWGQYWLQEHLNLTLVENNKFMCKPNMKFVSFWVIGKIFKISIFETYILTLWHTKANDQNHFTGESSKDH